jgi:hypothetical protein
MVLTDQRDIHLARGMERTIKMSLPQNCKVESVLEALSRGPHDSPRGIWEETPGPAKVSMVNASSMRVWL